MKQDIRIGLVPTYMKEFTCIGGECEDTCCKEWKVPIDRHTYKQYKNLKDKDLRPIFDQHIKRSRSNPHDEYYAELGLGPDGCPFLNESKLCSIQLKYGPEYLSKVCYTYPRTINDVNGTFEKSLNLSCPEAARKVLLKPEVMAFDELEETTDFNSSINNRISTANLPNTHKAGAYFWELRIFTIDLLQNRAFSLEERLMLLGLFYKKIQEVIDLGKVDDIPSAILSYSRLIEKQEKQSLPKVPVSTEVQFMLLKELVNKRLEGGINIKRYVDCLEDFLNGIGYEKGQNMDEMTVGYRRAYEQYYQPFMRNHEYILENYLVNYVFKNLFPFGADKDIFNQYVMLVIHYALIRLHLIGIAGFYKESFDCHHVIKLISSFCKAVEHSASYLQLIFDFMKKQGYTTMAYMAILINN